MKKLFHLLIAGVLVLSVTGCGKSETSKTRNAGLMSTSGLGTSLVTGIALNALTMIPGMPKELSTLLGGGGADNAEVLAAIAAIEAHLVKIDEKLAEISNQVKTVQSGVDDTIGLVNFVIKQNDCAATDAKYAQLLPLATAIDAKWKILFGDKVNAGLLRGIATRIKKDANNDALGNGEFTFTASETRDLNDVRRVLRDNQIDLALEKLGSILLSSGNSPGLIVSAQSCDTQRFLSSSDSELNSALVTGFQILIEKAATLQAWSKAYGETNFPVMNFNTTLLEFENIYRKLDVMKTMQIPKGQVLDTKTNKMWARGRDNVRLVEAMNGCPDASVDNTYRWMSPSGKAITERLRCLTSTAIDMPMTDSTEWRLPAIYEISQQATTKVNWQGYGGFPSAGDALFKNWKSGCGVTNTSECANVANFLGDNGASELVNPATTLKQVVGTALVDAHNENGLIWSSTSMAAASGSLPYPRATASTIVRENDKSLTTPRNPARYYLTDTNSFKNNRGLSKKHVYSIRTGDTHSRNYWAHNGPPCDALYGANEQRLAGGTYRGNCGDYRSSDFCHGGMQSGGNTVPRDKYFTYGDTPIPHTLASVRTANLGASSQEDEQVHAIASANEWGGSIDCTDTYDSSSTWSSGYIYTMLYLSVSFPEYARTLYVRDLKPNEFYTFSDKKTGGYGPKSSTKINEVVSATIGVFGVRGEFNVKALSAKEARCTLDPATAPTTFNTFLTVDDSCSVGSGTKSLKPGKHVVYAMAKSASGQDTELVRKEFNFEGTPPPKAEFTVTAKTNSIVATLTAAPNSDYDYEATAFDGATKQTCRITTTTCTISGLGNNVLNGVTIKTSWGTQVSVSEEQQTTPFGPPPAFTCSTVLAENNKVTLKCSSPADPAVGVQTPVAKYVVKNGSNVPVDCLPNTNCVINGLQNGVDTNLGVVATNDFGDTSQFITVRSIGKPTPPTGVVVSGSEGKIYVSWNRESTGDAAAKYVATATNGSAKYSCTSAQTMDAGIMTSPAPTECVITVTGPKTNSNLSYAVAVKGGNGNCSDIVPDVCNYSDSAPSTPLTVKPQFNPDRPTLVATVENSKITVAATAGTNDAQSTNKITIASAPTGLSCDASSDTQWKCVFDNFIRDQIYTFTGTGYNANNVGGAVGTSNAVTVYTAPAAPVISQTTTFDQKIYVSIGSSTDVIDSYTVTATAGTRNFTCSISKPNQSCEVTGLTNGTAYSVSATAQNNGGVSAPSVSVTGLKPFGVPTAQIAPAVTLDTAGGSAVFHLSVKPPANGVEITTYKVQMLNQEPTCTIVAPDTKCDIPVDDSFIGFGLQFTSTATNRIGESLPSLPSKTIEYEKAPLAPQDVILTTNFRDIIVEVLPDADSSIATKFAVTASPGNYSCAPAANGKCVLQNAARGKVYTITMKAINASGTSPASSRLYYLTAPPEAPEELITSASSAGLVVELGAGKTPTDTDSMLITATPSLGGAPLSCKIILPAKTCAITSDPSKTYKISAAGEATSGEKPSASKSFKPTGVVKTIAVATQNLAAPAAPLGASSEVTAAPQINKTIILEKKATSKIKIDSVYSAFIKSLPLSAGKVTLLKFSGKVKSDSKKICKTKSSDVILLKKGVCNISAKFKVIENKKSKTVELSAKITVG